MYIEKEVKRVEREDISPWHAVAIKAMVAEGYKIATVRCIREWYGCDLKAAVDCMRRVEEALRNG